MWTNAKGEAIPSGMTGMNADLFQINLYACINLFVGINDAVQTPFTQTDCKNGLFM